ncbi:hypothetical protein [Litoreibacter roseus]|uniref:Uncharacterized protein n=1 Tax=Litoreibacter roseus TaxID=2601869 RepID=A0A6N6JGM3_9RHOB|nr:hypothetical protein [Litoreibacter roseus]GFE64438.1 hypothetical protein KIN_15120 [Litoreibacter roseus]
MIWEILTLDFKMVRDRTYPDFVPNHEEVRVGRGEASAEIMRLDHGMGFIAFIDSPVREGRYSLRPR